MGETVTKQIDKQKSKEKKREKKEIKKRYNLHNISFKESYWIKKYNLFVYVVDEL